MKKIIILMIGLMLMVGCGSQTISNEFKLKMELTKEYDDTEPFIDARLFYIEKDVDSVTIYFSVTSEGGNGLLKIMDNQTKKVYWKTTWNQMISERKYTVNLTSLDKDHEYVIMFTGYEIKHTTIVITSDNDFIKERVRPQNEK